MAITPSRERSTAVSGKDRSLFADNRAFVGNPADYGVRGLSSRGGKERRVVVCYTELRR